MKTWLIRAVSHQYRQNTILIAGSFSFIAGILYAQFGSVSPVWLLIALLLIVVRNKGIAVLLVICFVSAVAGVWRGQVAIQTEEPIRRYFGQEVVVDAVITDDGYYDYKKRTAFNVQTFEMLSPDNIDLDVPLRVSGFAVSSATRGEVVRITGKVYPTVGNVAGAISYAEVENIGTAATFFDGVRQDFTAGLRNGLPEPAASLGAGILIGQRSSLTNQWQDIIRDSGLMHIIAVSGYNLTIIVRFVKRGMRNRSRYQILLLSGLLLIGFMAITGLSPSILRASIVVALLQLTWYYGRKIHPIVLLGLSAAISIAIDPFQIWRLIVDHLL